MSEKERHAIRRRTVLQGTAVGTAATLGLPALAAQEDPEADDEMVDDEDGNGAIFEEGPTVALETVAEGLSAPTDFVTADEAVDRRFILDQTGQIYVHGEEGLEDEPFLDVTDRMFDIDDDFDERGLLGLAFHPNFEENGEFFVRYSAEGQEPEYGAPGAEVPEVVDHLDRLSRFRTADEENGSADPDSEEILLEIPQPQFNHNAGPIAFGPDGYLYVTTGDGGGGGDDDEGHVDDWYGEIDGGNGQDTEHNLLGGILRIDVDDDGDEERAYGIPDDNPLVGYDDHLPEYWAWGLRNPWGMSFENGELLAADVGQALFETVNHVEAGGNYGWNPWEGTHCFDPATPEDPPEDCPDVVADDVPEPRGGEPLLGPVIEYPQEADMGRYADEYDEAGTLNGERDRIGVSMIGGHMYEGTAVEELQDTYVFGDWSWDGQGGGRIFIARPPEGWADDAEAELEPGENDAPDNDNNAAEDDDYDENEESNPNSNCGCEDDYDDKENGYDDTEKDDKHDDEKRADAEKKDVDHDENDYEEDEPDVDDPEAEAAEPEDGDVEPEEEPDEEMDDEPEELMDDDHEYHPPDEVDLWPMEELTIEGDIASDGTLDHLVYAFGRDTAGEVYVLTSSTATIEGEGYVSRIVPADELEDEPDEPAEEPTEEPDAEEEPPETDEEEPAEEDDAIEANGDDEAATA